MDVEDQQQQQQEDLTQGQEHHVAGTESAAAGTSTPVAPDVNWQERATQYESVLQQLAPYASEIQELFFDADPSERAFLQQARKLYKEQGSQTPELPPELKAIHDDVVYLKDYVSEARKAQEQQQKAAQQESFARDYQYAQRLAAERPDLLEDNGWAISALKGYADQNHLTLEQAWKKVGSRFAKPQKQAAPPSSLRGDAGEIGIPGRSDTQAASTEMSLRDRLLMELRKQRTG